MTDQSGSWNPKCSQSSVKSSANRQVHFPKLFFINSVLGLFIGFFLFYDYQLEFGNDDIQTLVQHFGNTLTSNDINTSCIQEEWTCVKKWLFDGNKCLNERRRRDQENLYFEELAELISASITDMTSMSVKPEKCAILQESLKQIKQIKEEAKTEAVQQAQVSSSKPSVLANRFFGPRILEALDGFLFVVNNQGKVDYVSDNITQYLKYTEDDLLGKSIYNFIHVGDHGQFSNCLLPMSVGEVFAWPADVNVQGRTFICRMLIKPPSEESDDVEIKQTCISQYESMQISAILHSGDRNEPNEATDCSSCLVCVARRLSFAEKTNTMLGIEQFTTKQDLTGKIIASDTSGIAPGHYCCPNLVGQHLQDLCHVNDIQTISKHIQEVLKTGVNTSTVYRFKFQDSRFVFVQTKSKLFTRNNGDNNDFVMSTHSIIRQCDNDNELKGSASSSLMKSIIGNSPLVREQRNTTPGVPNNIATMLGALNPNQFPLRSPVSPSPHQPSMEDSLDALDIFSSSSWDSPIPDSSGIISSLGSNGNSVYSLPSLTSPVSSNMNSMNSVNQMKLTNSMEQQQQQHQQHQQQQRQMLLSQQLPNMANKQQQQQLQMNFQKKSSFDSGQKSPVFSQGVGPKQNKAFSMPSPHGAMQGNLMGFSSQRSPGSVTSMAQNRMSPGGNMNMGMSYPLQRTSPAAGVTQNPLMASVSQNQTWVRMNSVGSSVGASPAQSPLQALQSMDTQQSNGMGPATLLSPSFRNNMEFTFPPSSDTRLPGLDKRTGSARQGRLCQLLKGNSVSSEYDITHSPLIDSNAGVKDGDRKDISGLKSPTDSINQSPQPGPGVSPPDRPQSSTHGEENEVAPSRKSNDIILKQLLNQDEEDKPKNRKSSLLPLLGSDSESNSGEAVAKEEEMNEAEAKDNSKKSNILLQQLLSEDHSKGERKKHSSGELLTILLNEDPENNCTSAPAESTSQDSDLLQRRRHISGPQEPQSTTSNPLTPLTPLTPVSSQGSFPQPPTPTQPSSNMKSFLMSPPQSTDPTGPASGFGRSQKMEKPSQITNKNLDSFLRTMWEQEDDRPTPVQNKGVKRKSPPTDSVSKDDDPLSALSSSPSLQAQQPPQNSQGSGKTNQKNELLKRLLSKQTENETKICTTQYHTCNPSENPHQRFQNSNLESKILKVKRNEKVKDSNSDKDRKMDTSEVKDPMILLGQNEALTSAFTPNKLTSSASFDQSMLSQISSQEQFSQLISTSSSSLSEIDQLAMGENDFLLEKILQEAVEMHQDFNKANSGMGGGGSQGSELNNNSSAGGMQMQQGESADDNCSILNAFDLDLDKMLGISTDGTIHTDANDKMAIEAIQKALMNDDTIQSNTSVGLSSHVQSSQAFSQALMFPKALPTSQAQAMTQMGASNLDLQFRLQQQQQQQQIKRAGHVDPSMQQQGFSQAAPNNFGTQVPRIPGPQVPPVSALQQRPVFNNPNSTAMQVRQSLLQQQKMKQMRELDKQKRQTQYNMLQQRLQFSQRFPHQSIDNNVQSFPENLGDLMNSGNAPNVSIKQNNQIPGPMSPQFGPVPMQPLMGQSGSGPQMSPGQQQTSMNQMMGPSPSQMSPHFSQPAQNQWSMPGRGHTTPQSPMGVPQGAQFNIGRHRSMSGGNTPVNAKGNQFQFPDNQFGNQGQGQMGMFNQQQQQQQQSMFSQNRHLQRQLSLPPGRGSPRTSQSPFSPDMMSPHPISPNNAIRPTSNSQVSPPFGQHGTNMGQVNKMGQGFASDFDLAALDQLEGKHMGNVASSYIKQELRNMCNARFEKQALQQNQQQAIQQMAQIQQQQQQQKQQQQQQQHQQQQQQQQESSEIPFEIFEQISEMAKEHGISSMPNVSLTLDDFKEEDVLRQKREDAKERYQKLQALAKPQKQEHENPEVKATNLFKSQLTTTGTSIPVGTVHENRTRIQVVQKEPRTCEEMRPPDHKNSLLQKLLSE